MLPTLLIALGNAPPHPNANGAPAACHPANLPMGGSHSGSAQIPGPTKTDATSVAAWLANMKDMREKCATAVGYDAAGATVSDPALEWTQTAYMGPQMHPYDRFFYNESLGNGTNGVGYTVDKWLADLNARYGGIDQALIWPTYTNIGIDDRNTFDLIRSMPGGAKGIKVVVDQLHAKGVKVLWPYHPWDDSTKGQEFNNVTDFLAMAHLLQDTNSDGFNGDTMDHIPKAFIDASKSIGYKAIAMQAEGGLEEWMLPYNTMGWGEGWEKDQVYVDKPKWLTRGKASTNWCDRWSGNQGNSLHGKTPELQINWFNGLGYETWENVWGTWNGIIERSAEAIRRVAMMLRFFGHRGFFISKDWIPFTSEATQYGMGNKVYASAFPLGKETVYTFINWGGDLSSGVQLTPSAAHQADHYYDCYNGVELTAVNGAISFGILPNGFGCVIATPNATTIDYAAGARTFEAMRAGLTGGAPSVPTTLSGFLGAMASMTKKPLSAYDNTFHYLPQMLVNANASTKVRPLNDSAKDEVYISGGIYHFKASGIEIEGRAGSGVDVQFPWEMHPQRNHERQLKMSALYVDKYPVTNAKYAAYLKASNYVPSDRQNWLKHSFNFPSGSWSSGAPSGVKKGWEEKPVTYVSHLDAEAYCKHESKRLPSAIEWQFIAQGGNETKLYPWGSIDNADFTPAVNNDWVNPGPEPVGAHPDGASVHGVEDLVRSVWQMTSIFEDIHTRSMILRGGSNYGPWRGGPCRWIENDDGTPRNVAPACFANAEKTPVPGSRPHLRGGSHWYFPQAFELNTYNKIFLMGGSYDRAGTVGFRCVADAVDDCGTDLKLCIDIEPLKTRADVELNEGGGSQSGDWAHFTKAGGKVPVRKASNGNALVIGFDYNGVETGVVAPNGTSFSWTHGTAPTPTGAHDFGGVLISAAADGFSPGGVSIQAPAMPLLADGTSKTLTVYLGPSNVGGVVTAIASGYTKTMAFESSGGILTFAYDVSSDLAVHLSNLGSGAPCALAQLMSDGACVGVPTAVTASVDLSVASDGGALLDWKHWGGIKKSGPAPADWGVDGMAAPKVAGIQVPTCTVSATKKPCQPTEYSNAAASYTWSDGAPTKTASGSGGVYAGTGTFQLKVLGAKTKGTPQRLTLYVGVFSTQAKMVVTTAKGKSYTQHVGKGGGTRNLAFTIDFIGDITVEWGRDGDEKGGNLTWQAAVLEALESQSGKGVVLQAVVLE